MRDSKNVANLFNCYDITGNDTNHFIAVKIFRVHIPSISFILDASFFPLQNSIVLYILLLKSNSSLIMQSEKSFKLVSGCFDFILVSVNVF